MRTMLIIGLLAVGTTACDKGDDKFEGVDPVTAPKSSEPAQPVAKSAGNLPSDHPPVGDTKNVPSIPEPDMVRFAATSDYGKTGPLRWTAPEGWQPAKPATSMRLAEYVVPSPDGEAAVLSIFHFGPGGGGGVEANVTRWVGQFDGGKAKAKRGEKDVNGMKVHTVDAAGTYNPGMAGGGAPAKDDHRMLGAIVESDAGLYFFKLVGPKGVVDAQASKWDTFVGSFEKGS